MAMDITEMKIKTFAERKDNLRAVGSFELNGCVSIRYMLKQAKSGDLFVSMPGRYGNKKDPETGRSKWFHDVFFTDRDLLTQVQNAILSEYFKSKESLLETKQQEAHVSDTCDF